VCCDAINFFADTGSARGWAGRHPDVAGGVVDQQQAEQLGAHIFGSLLHGRIRATAMRVLRGRR
jgi:hypothetical protein